MAPSAENALGVPPEILEAILLNLSFHDLFTVQRVCVQLRDAIKSSKGVQRAMFLVPAKEPKQIVPQINPLLRTGYKLGLPHFDILIHPSTTQEGHCILLRIMPRDMYVPLRSTPDIFAILPEQILATPRNTPSWWRTLLSTTPSKLEFEVKIDRLAMQRGPWRKREQRWQYWKLFSNKVIFCEVEGTFETLDSKLSEVVRGWQAKVSKALEDEYQVRETYRTPAELNSGSLSAAWEALRQAQRSSRF